MFDIAPKNVMYACYKCYEHSSMYLLFGCIVVYEFSCVKYELVMYEKICFVNEDIYCHMP